MHEERLKQLRRVVEDAPDDRLHMRSWCEEADCGTAYCAAGWAAIDPWFLKNTEIGHIFAVDDEGRVRGRTNTGDEPTYLAHLFDISDAVAWYLFMAVPASADPHHVTKAMVLANIDLIMAGKPAMYYGDMKEGSCTKND